MAIEIGIEEKQTISPSIIAKRIGDNIKNLKRHPSKVLFVCEDNTRGTPIHSFFPQVLDFVRSDLKISDVAVLFALGTHRPMTQAEMFSKLGLDSKKAEGIFLINHNAYDTSGLVEIGVIDDVSVKLNRMVFDYDYSIFLGSVIPHRVMGFSGGAKMLCPGIANREIINYSHWQSNEYAEKTIMANMENPMRRFLDHIASMAESHCLKNYVSVNFVATHSGIVGIFMGTFRSSYLSAANLSASVFVRKVKTCNSVLALLDDKCIDFWQAAKAVYNCGRVINSGGSIVIAGKLVDGISSVHGKTIEKFGYAAPAEIRKLVDNGQLTDTVVASHMIRVGQYLEKIKIYLSSENINPEVCARVNLGYLHPDDINRNNFDYVVYNPVDLILDSNQ